MFIGFLAIFTHIFILIYSFRQTLSCDSKVISCSLIITSCNNIIFIIIISCNTILFPHNTFRSLIKIRSFTIISHNFKIFVPQVIVANVN